MKKNIIIVLLGVMILGVIGGIICMTIKDRKIQINIQELGEKLKEEVDFEDDLELSEKEICIKNYGFDQERIQDLVYYTGSGATAEEILLLELKEEKDVGKIEEQILMRKEEQKEIFSDYAPEEVEKLEKSKIKKQGKYVILSIAKDSESAIKIVNEYIKGK